MKLKYQSFIIIFLFSINSILEVKSQDCRKDTGCMAKAKFLTYTTSVSIDGLTSEVVKDVNFKLVFLLEKGITIMNTNDSTSKIIEDSANNKFGDNTNMLVRSIPYGQIVMDCGVMKNKLCTIEEYPYKDIVAKARGEISKVMSAFIDTHCIVVPFFDEKYKKKEDKLAIFCLKEAGDIYEVLKYRDLFSRKIEKEQNEESLNANTTNNSINRELKKMVTFNDQHFSVPVDVQIKKNVINLTGNQKEMPFFKAYSLFQLKDPKTFAKVVNEAIPLDPKKLKTWNANLKPSPTEQCCIFYSGETNDLLLCLANDQGNLETNDEKCKTTLKEIENESYEFIYRLQLMNSIQTLQTHTKKQADCSDKLWDNLKKRYEAAGKHAINNCKQIFLYAPDPIDIKSSNCKKQYLLDIDHEIRLLINYDIKFEAPFKKCVVKEFPDIMDTNEFNSKIAVFGGIPTYSFKEIRSSKQKTLK